MNITPEIEKNLWISANVSQVADIPGFPFGSHAGLKAAVASGHIQLGIEYAAARGFVSITKSPGAAALILALTWVMPALGIGSVLVAFVTGNWWALCGVVTAFLGQTLANPYSPAQSLWKILVVGAVLHLAAADSITTGLTWASFSFAGSAVALRVLNRLAWRWAHNAVLASEAFAAYLFRTRNLHIRDSTGKHYNAAHADISVQR
jgi:hypothetical protein